MGDGKRLNFDFPTLLKLGDLDIRRIAAEKRKNHFKSPNISCTTIKNPGK
jgi:hypothetical protein